MKHTYLIIYFFTISLSLNQCTHVSDSKQPVLKVAVIKFQHETCTFCPGGDTQVEDWIKYSEPLNGEDLLESGSYIKGFVHQARDFPDMELMGITSLMGVFDGSSRSWNSEESFNHFMEIILKELKSIQVDGVYLALHGAMATRKVLP